MTELEQQIIGIISAAGDSKGKAFEALRKVKERELAHYLRKAEKSIWRHTKSRPS